MRNVIELRAVKVDEHLFGIDLNEFANRLPQENNFGDNC